MRSAAVIERHDRADARASGLDGSRGALQGGVAVAGNQNRRSGRIGFAVRLGRIRVHATPKSEAGPSKNAGRLQSGAKSAQN